MSEEPALRHETLGAALLLMLAAALRLVHLDRGITGDEVILYRLAGRPLAEIHGAVMGQEIYSPLGPYLLHLWMGLGGPGEVWVRLYFVLFGLGLCAVVYWMGRELLGSPGALLVLAAAAVSPFLIATSQYIRNYTDGSFWSALGLVALVRIWRGRGGPGAWLLYAGATLTAFYTFYFTLLVWAAIILWLSWRLWKEARPWGPWAAVQAAVAAGMVPGLLMAWYQIPHNAYSLRFNWAETGFQLAGVHVGVLGRNLLALLGFDPAFGFPGISRWIPVWALALLLAAVLAGCAIVLRVGWGRLQAGAFPGGASFCVVVALFPLGVAHVVGELSGIFPHSKYFLLPHAMFLVMMVAAVRALPRRALTVAACALLTLAYASRLEAVYQPDYDVRGVDRYIATIQRQGSIVLLLGPLPVAGQRPGAGQPERPSLDLQEFFRYDFGAGRYRLGDGQKLDAALAGIPRAIYVRMYSNQEVFGGNSAVLDYLAARGFELESSKRFKSLDVMSFVNRRGDGKKT